MKLKIIRFILRFILLVIAIGAGVYFITFVYAFHTLSVEQLYDTVAIISNRPLTSALVGVGVLLFTLSLLGLVMLVQYQVWRYPLSIFAGYIIGLIIYYHFYTLHPFQEGVLHLNNNIWYSPLIVSTALLFRAAIGFKLSKIKKSNKSNN